MNYSIDKLTILYTRENFSCLHVHALKLFQSSSSLSRQVLSDKANLEHRQCGVFNKVVQCFTNRAVSTSHGITATNESCEVVNRRCQVYLHI